MTSRVRLFDLAYLDAGEYQCVIANEYGATYSEKAEILVYVFPEFLTRPEDITVRGNKTASLKCAAQGFPTPKVSW